MNMLKQNCSIMLFSGMAADANVFVGQKVAFEQLVVPSWPVPLTNESIDAYAKRLADELKNMDIQILGGASFGGIMAMHVAQHLKPKAVLLIGSVASPAELPGYVRWLKPLRFAVQWLPIGLIQVLAMPLTASVFKKLMPSVSGLVRQFVRCDARVLRWSMEQVLTWQTAPTVSVPVFHVYGDRDWILPLNIQRRIAWYMAADI